MSDPKTIERFASDPATFRQSLIVDTDGGPVPFGNVLDPWQREDFQALDPGWCRVVLRAAHGGYDRGFLERPRGHSKTLDIAVMALWAVVFSRRQLRGAAAAADRDQARLLRDAIAKLVGLNGWLKEVIEVQTNRVLNTRTKSELIILSSDVNSSFGLTCDFIVADELTHWQSPDLWHSLVSTAGKREHCLLLVISNAGVGKGSSWQWTAREKCRREPKRWYFRSLERPCASWISEETLAEQRRLLPELAFRRLWLNEWTATSGDALTEDDIRAAVRPDLGPMSGTEPGWEWSIGLDIGVRRDLSALVTLGRHIGHAEQLDPAPVKPLPITLRAMIDLDLIEGPEMAEPEYHYHPGTEFVRLASCASWTPRPGEPVDLDAVELTTEAAAKRFNAVVNYDPNQCEQIACRLQKRGIVCNRVPFVGARLTSMASATLETFRSRTIELYDDPELIRDLERLNIVQRSFGYKLEASREPGFGHSDRAFALVLALLFFRENSMAMPSTVQGPLVCWPS